MNVMRAPLSDVMGLSCAFTPKLGMWGQTFIGAPNHCACPYRENEPGLVLFPPPTVTTNRLLIRNWLSAHILAKALVSSTEADLLFRVS